jgi:hypothetical protein
VIPLVGVLVPGCGSSSAGGCVYDAECAQNQYCASDGNCYLRVECEIDEDCDKDEYCSVEGDCRLKPTIDGTQLPVCDVLEIEPSAIPPNVLLAVDKSGSMKDPTAAGGRAKIQDTKEALNALLDGGEGEINFGWLQFPVGSRCQPGTVTVPCSLSSVTEIRQKVSALVPDGGTPTGGSLRNALAYEDLHDETRASFVILLTDGMPTCPNGGGQNLNDADNQLALDAVGELRAANIDTFVIGLGEDLNNPETTNPELLNQLAMEGGRPRAGQNTYYMANSLEELNQALENIEGQVIGCTLGLRSEPEHPGYLWVFFDGDSIDRDPDHIDGWDYDGIRNQTNFYGPACDRLRSGMVDRVEVLMGCGPPV